MTISWFARILVGLGINLTKEYQLRGMLISTTAHKKKPTDFKSQTAIETGRDHKHLTTLQ